MPIRAPLLALGALAAAVLAGCAAPRLAPPRPVALGPGVWRVEARARSAPQAHLRALREAADLTLSRGGDWFRVQGRGDPDADNTRDIGLTDDLASSSSRGSHDVLDIEVGRGPRPRGADVYDAHEVSARLGGRARPVGTPV